MKEGGGVDDGEHRGQGGALGHANWLVVFVCKEVVEMQLDLPIGKEGHRPIAQGSVEAK